MPYARIIANALTYFAAIFALGFVLGALRVFWLAPRIGAMAAVLVEMPVMLAASWLCAGALLRRRPLASREGALAMGLVSFMLLMGAELVLGVAGFGQTPGEWLAALARAPGLAGLAGQSVFALMPAMLWGARR